MQCKRRRLTTKGGGGTERGGEARKGPIPCLARLEEDRRKGEGEGHIKKGTFFRSVVLEPPSWSPSTLSHLPLGPPIIHAAGEWTVQSGLGEEGGEKTGGGFLLEALKRAFYASR